MPREDTIDISSDKTPSQSADSLYGKKVLWVEDDKFLSDIIARKLSEKKCLLLHATDGEQALKLAGAEHPDIILLDIILPGIDGFEILARLKSNPETKNIPVILLSNLGQQSDFDKGRKLGAVRFLIKATVTLDEILSEIKFGLVPSPRQADGGMGEASGQTLL